MKKWKFYGISEGFGRTLEWNTARGGQVKQTVCPAIRSVDYKVNKLVWYEKVKDKNSK